MWGRHNCVREMVFRFTCVVLLNLHGQHRIFEIAVHGFDRVRNYSNLTFKTTKNHPCKTDIYVGPLLFPWPRSVLPTYSILESPLVGDHSENKVRTCTLQLLLGPLWKQSIYKLQLLLWSF